MKPWSVKALHFDFECMMSAKRAADLCLVQYYNVDNTNIVDGAFQKMKKNWAALFKRDASLYYIATFVYYILHLHNIYICIYCNICINM